MTTRRHFFATAAAVFAAPYARLPTAGALLPLGFSTLGCPTWTWTEILDFARSHGFAAVELRGLQKTMDLSQAPEFSREGGRLDAAKDQVRERGLRVSDLGASAQMH